MSDFVDVIPLGGLGEFGMNCAVLSHGKDMILLDAGVAFPRGDLGLELGVRVIIPDMAFLREHRDQLRGVVLTHGHEDHVGAVPFLIQEFDLPVHGSALTLGLVSEKLREHKLLERARLHEIKARERIEMGPFEIEPLNVTHSFPDSFCLAIGTPIGRLIWTGDFKFDPTPIDGKASDLHRLAAYGEDGVLALFSDSTNSLTEGLAPSEDSVLEPIRDVFRRSHGKIAATTFASSIHRIQIFCDLASEFGRKVVALGRSMVTNIRVARELGTLHVQPDLIITPGAAEPLDPSQLLVLASGSQGEPMSAMSRLAVQSVKGITVEDGDTVLLSTRMIPGNEMPINRMLNHYVRRGAKVYDASHSRVHVSGHGFRDDLKLMINLTRPHFFVPIHGEYRQLKMHQWIARDQGIAEENTRLIENGEVLRLTRTGMEVVDRVPAGRRFIDEGAFEEVPESVLKDRRSLAEDGFVMAVLQLDRFSGDLIGEPEIVSRGFVMIDEGDGLLTATRRKISEVVAETPLELKQDENLFNELLRKELRKLFRRRTGKRPLVVPLTLEI